MTKIQRYVVVDHDGHDGSIFACSKDCANDAAENLGVELGECQGDDGVDDLAVCDGCWGDREATCLGCGSPQPALFADCLACEDCHDRDPHEEALTDAERNPGINRGRLA